MYTRGSKTPGPATGLISRRAIALAPLLAGASTGWAQGLSDPQKRLRIIVPYGSGSGVDVVARVIAERLADRTRQAVIVENKPGGSAMVGVAALKNAPADGTTIGILVSGNAAQPWMTKDLQFDIRRDFTPLTLLYSGPLVMTVATSLPVKTLAEFVAYAKANPGKISYGSLGSGTTTHLAAELLAQSAGLQMTQIPYKGSNEIHTAVASGDVTMSFDNYVSPRALVDAGRLRALVSTGAKRSQLLPAIPTLAETYPGVELGFWTGFAAPKGTPKPIVDQLARDLRAVIQTPQVQQQLIGSGSVPGGGTPEEFETLINDNYEKFGRLIRAAGIKPE